MKLFMMPVCVLLLSACERAVDPAPKASPGLGAVSTQADISGHRPETIALSRFGEISLSEVESWLPQQRGAVCRKIRQGKASDIEQVEACYRAIAQERVIEEALIEREIKQDSTISHGDALIDRALRKYLDDNPGLEQNLVLQPFREQMREDIEVSEQEISDYYAQHPDQFVKPASALLFSLYRRHQDAEHTQVTLDFLKQLKGRLLLGEKFEQLARKYSHSESRSNGGRIGVVKQGKLDPKLEAVLFSLQDGEVSEPVLARGGAVLLMAKRVQPAYTLTLADARSSIEVLIKEEKLQEQSERILAENELPEGSLILASEQLIAALDDADTETTVLKIGALEMNAGQLRTLARLGQQAAGELDEKQREGLYKVYRERADNHRLYLYVRAGQTQEQKNLIEARLQQYQRSALNAYFEQSLQQGLDKQLADRPAELEQYFQDNRSGFMSPLSYKLSIWDLPLNERPTDQMARMEQLQQKLSTETFGLEQAVEQLGGSITHWDLQTSKDLSKKLPKKAINILAKSAPGTYTPPYQQDHALHLIWLEQRVEPRRLTYEQAREQVADAYKKRYGKQLYATLKQAYLEDNGFEFLSQRFRQLWSE